jgi:hypothetical protein
MGFSVWLLPSTFTQYLGTLVARGLTQVCGLIKLLLGKRFLTKQLTFRNNRKLCFNDIVSLNWVSHTKMSNFLPFKWKRNSTVTFKKGYWAHKTFQPIFTCVVAVLTGTSWIFGPCTPCTIITRMIVCACLLLVFRCASVKNFKGRCKVGGPEEAGLALGSGGAGIATNNFCGCCWLHKPFT